MSYHVVLDPKTDIHEGDIEITDVIKEVLIGEVNENKYPGPVRKILHTEYSYPPVNSIYKVKLYLECGHFMHITLNIEDKIRSSPYGVGLVICETCIEENKK